VVTTVEPEERPSGLRGRRLLLVAGALVAAVALVIAGARALGNDDLVVDPTIPPPSDDPAHIADASFVLQNYGTLTPESRQFWQDLTLDHVVSLGLPFSRHNRYYTRFFLKEGETVEIMVESNVPLGASLEGSLEGLAIMLIPGSAPYDQSHAHAYLPPTESGNGGYFARLQRLGGNWQVGWAMSALTSDYYWLILTNTARQDAWCHFTVNVPSD
jgi:hypothetical protein